MAGPTAPSLRPSPPEADRPGAPADVRDALFAPLAGRRFGFEITARQGGVLAGSRRLAEKAGELGLEVERLAADGDPLAEGACVLRARGDAWQVARAEEQLLGLVGKAAGVATAAAEMVALSRGRARIVCGAWKKIPPEARPGLREAIGTGGAGLRILDRPFVYLDKNYVRMLGGIVPAVRQARRVRGRAVVVQLRGETAAPGDEAEAAATEGADVLMVDTGDVADLAEVAERVRARTVQGGLEVGFGGGVHAANLEAVLGAGARVVDVGRAIVDAPLIDFRLDVR